MDTQLFDCRYDPRGIFDLPGWEMVTSPTILEWLEDPDNLDLGKYNTEDDMEIFEEDNMDPLRQADEAIMHQIRLDASKVFIHPE